MPTSSTECRRRAPDADVEHLMPTSSDFFISLRRAKQSVSIGMRAWGRWLRIRASSVSPSPPATGCGSLGYIESKVAPTIERMRYKTVAVPAVHCCEHCCLRPRWIIYNLVINHTDAASVCLINKRNVEGRSMRTISYDSHL